MNRRTQVDRSPHWPIWIANFATTLLSAAGIAAYMAWLPTAIGNPADGATLSERSPMSAQHAAARGDMASASMSSHAPSRTTCVGCGVIELMREIDTFGEHETKSTKSYEFTIRFQDGSTRVFNEATPRTWRPGARVMVID